MNRAHRTLLPLLVAGMALTGCGTTAARPSSQGGVTVDAALHSALPAAVRSKGELVVAIDPSYAPMESYGKNGRAIVGMEPDLARELGAVLGVKVQLRDTAFNDILTDVAQGKVDVGLSAITDTAERTRTVDFVDYFHSGSAIIVQRGNPHHIRTLSDLCGTTVAAERGTVQAALLLRTQRGCGEQMKVQQYTTNSDALLRLRTGRAVAVMNDMPPAALLSTDPKTKAFYQLASSTQYESGYFGLAVSKQDAGLRSVLQRGVGRLIADGAYGRVLRRWGLQDGAVPTSLVNSGRAGAA